MHVQSVLSAVLCGIIIFNKIIVCSDCVHMDMHACHVSSCQALQAGVSNAADLAVLVGLIKGAPAAVYMVACTDVTAGVSQLSPLCAF